MSLQDKLDKLRAGFEADAPPAALAVMHRATADLQQSGILAGVKKPREAAPAFNLPDTEGRTVTSADLFKNGPLVLGFYRGVW